MICENCDCRKVIPKLHGAAMCGLTGIPVGLADHCNLPDTVRLSILGARMANRLETDGVDASLFDDLIHDLFGKVASGVNNEGLFGQMQAVYEHLGDEATEAISEVLGARSDRINAEADALGLLGTWKEYTDAIQAIEDAFDGRVEDPGLHEARKLLQAAFDKQWPDHS